MQLSLLATSRLGGPYAPLTWLRQVCTKDVCFELVQRGEKNLHNTQHAVFHWSPSRRHHLVSFPGMLSLGDAAHGRPGYLRLLGGLKKLKKLVGFVLANTTETRLTMGLREVVWIDEHWPLLQVAGSLGRVRRCMILLSGFRSSADSSVQPSRFRSPSG